MSKHLLKYCLIVLLMVTAGELKSQDIHFSQFYNSPLSLNPAMTGLMKEDIRASAIYRNQWKQANAQFQTMAFAGDINFPIKPTNPDRIAAGIFLLNDKMGGGIIVNNSAFLSLAYHKIIGHSRRFKLSSGIQGGYVQKTIDYSSLYFTSQINNYQFDPNLVSGENLDKNSFNYVNLNAGVGGSYKVNGKTEVFSGISFFNTIKPRENFNPVIAAEEINKLKGRFTWTGTASYRMSEKMVLLPALLVMKQAKVVNLNIGSSVGYLLNGNTKTMVQGGVGYRNKDAIIAMGGFRFNHFSIGVTRDFTVSGLDEVKKSPTVDDRAGIGAWEISLTYVGFLKRPLPGDLTIPCRFF